MSTISKIIDDKYGIGEVVGSGGMGVVYAATNMETDQTVALKLLHNKYAHSPKIIKRFYQEAKLADSLQHPNICSVIDHGCTEDGSPYLVMPLLKGRPFSKMLGHRKLLPTSQVVRIVSQTLSALEAAHRRKVIHRDMKPENIFVLSEGSTPDTVKLLDFGISKVIETGRKSTLTSTGMVLGTAYYLAPEQARGSRHLDHRVDIYAVGVILYESLTGHMPFQGETYNEVIIKVASSPYQSPRAINPKLSPAMEWVIKKAMSFVPHQRFDSAEEMNVALKKALDGTFERVPPLTDEFTADTEKMVAVNEQRSSVRTDRRRRFSAIGAGLGLSLSLGLFGLYLGKQYLHDQPKKAQSPQDVSIIDKPASPKAEGAAEQRPAVAPGTPTLSPSIPSDEPVRTALSEETPEDIRPTSDRDNAPETSPEKPIQSQAGVKRPVKKQLPKRSRRTFPEKSLEKKSADTTEVLPAKADPEKDAPQTATKVSGSAECTIVDDGICLRNLTRR